MPTRRGVHEHRCSVPLDVVVTRHCRDGRCLSLKALAGSSNVHHAHPGDLGDLRTWSAAPGTAVPQSEIGNLKQEGKDREGWLA